MRVSGKGLRAALQRPPGLHFPGFPERGAKLHPQDILSRPKEIPDGVFPYPVHIIRFSELAAVQRYPSQRINSPEGQQRFVRFQFLPSRGKGFLEHIIPLAGFCTDSFLIAVIRIRKNAFPDQRIQRRAGYPAVVSPFPVHHRPWIIQQHPGFLPSVILFSRRFCPFLKVKKRLSPYETVKSHLYPINQRLLN